MLFLLGVHLLTICSTSVVLGIKPGVLPDSYQRCSVSDPSFDECIIKAVRHAFTLLDKGIPNLGVLPIDPLEISNIEIQQGQGGTKLSLNLNNIFIRGLRNIQVHNVTTNLLQGGFDMGAHIFIKEFQMLSEYTVGGRILILPISGEGRSNFTLRNVRTTVTLTNEKIKDGNEEYIKVNKFIFKMNPEILQINLENLFGGNKLLSEQMNEFLNQNNGLEIYGELGPSIEEAFGEVLKQISNRIFLKVPYKTIFLD